MHIPLPHPFQPSISADIHLEEQCGGFYDVASINLGYHLIYYGDQAPEDGYYDQGGEQCEGTVKSIFRRLRSEHYKDVWALDLVTLRTLLDTRGREILRRNEHDASFLEQFLQRNHQDQGNAFQQEQQQLQKILQGALP